MHTNKNKQQEVEEGSSILPVNPQGQNQTVAVTQSDYFWAREPLAAQCQLQGVL